MIRAGAYQPFFYDMIAIISSTNRKGAVSYKVAQFYKTLLDSKNIENKIIDLEKLPTDFSFSALYENSGKNEVFNTFKDIINQADKFIFVIPEYNGSFPGVLKAFIDGQDFPGSLKNKFAALIGISSGTQGSALAMGHFSDILSYLGCHVIGIKPRCIEIEKCFDGTTFTDEKLMTVINDQVDALLSVSFG